MPYSFPNNIPRPAMHWTDSEKKKCIAAANSVLSKNGSEQEAIFACIHAAGKSKRKQVHENDYEEAGADAMQAFQLIMNQYYDGVVSIKQLETSLKNGIDRNLVRMMLLGIANKRKPTSEDMDWIEERMDSEHKYLDSFINELKSGNISREAANWRVGLYAFPRSAFTRFQTDVDVADLMPVLPGDDCLGLSACRCSLEQEVVGDEIHVNWMVDPASESCSVCLAHAMESPFIFTFEDLGRAG